MTYFGVGDSIELWEGTDLGQMLRRLRDAETYDPESGPPANVTVDGIEYFAAGLFREPQANGTALHKVLMLRRSVPGQSRG